MQKFKRCNWKKLIDWQIKKIKLRTKEKGEMLSYSIWCIQKVPSLLLLGQKNLDNFDVNIKLINSKHIYNYSSEHFALADNNANNWFASTTYGKNSFFLFLFMLLPLEWGKSHLKCAKIEENWNCGSISWVKFWIVTNCITRY